MIKLPALENRTEAQELAMIESAKRQCATPIREPRDLIKLAYERHNGGLAVAWSGGRCSTVVLHMVRGLEPNIKVVFCDTGVEYPETYKFVREIAHEWNLNLTWAKPEMTFWQCVEKFGFPYMRLPSRDVKKGKKGVPRCCYHLKEKPMTKLHKDGVEAVLTGMRVVEARIRMFNMRWHGQFYFAKKYGHWKYNPIAFWSTEELNRYIAEHGVPMSDIYTKRGLGRSGCWPCTGYRNWEKTMAKTNPGFLRYLKEKMGQRILDHYFKTQVEHPCGTEAI